MAKKQKTIRHLGMTMTEKEHEQWHREHRELTPEEHDQLMKHMGITPEEDEKWHREHGPMTMEDHAKMAGMMERMGISKDEQEKWHKGQPDTRAQSVKSDAEPLNPFAIGGGFLAYCVKQGWLTQEGKGPKARYFATEQGRRELARFDIKV